MLQPDRKFILATPIARGLRYYGLARLVSRFGDDAGDRWERNQRLASAVAAGILAAVILTTRYLAELVM
ncbi:MAG: hypothetical protein P8X98_06620 [Woeseiaceae bacterium]